MKKYAAAAALGATAFAAASAAPTQADETRANYPHSLGMSYALVCTADRSTTLHISTKIMTDDREAGKKHVGEAKRQVRLAWKNALGDTKIDEVIYNEDPKKYKLYSAEKEKAFYAAVEKNMADSFGVIKQKTGVSFNADTNLHAAEPGCVIGG